MKSNLIQIGRRVWWDHKRIGRCVGRVRYVGIEWAWVDRDSGDKFIYPIRGHRVPLMRMHDYFKQEDDGKGGT